MVACSSLSGADAPESNAMAALRLPPPPPPPSMTGFDDDDDDDDDERVSDAIAGANSETGRVAIGGAAMSAYTAYRSFAVRAVGALALLCDSSVGKLE